MVSDDTEHLHGIDNQLSSKRYFLRFLLCSRAFAKSLSRYYNLTIGHLLLSLSMKSVKRNFDFLNISGWGNKIVLV